MEEFTINAFANRDEAIPLISFDDEDDLSDEVDGGAAETTRKRDIFKGHGKNKKENIRPAGASMQDRILEKWAMTPPDWSASINRDPGYCSKSYQLRTWLPRAPNYLNHKILYRGPPSLSLPCLQTSVDSMRGLGWYSSSK